MTLWKRQKYGDLRFQSVESREWRVERKILVPQGCKIIQCNGWNYVIALAKIYRI
jgi:hypothetical protein